MKAVRLMLRKRMNDEPQLNRTVTTFLWEGLLRGDALVVIATPRRLEDIARHLEWLGADVARSRREGQIAMLDAHETLARILDEGQPHWERIETVISEALEMARPRAADAGTRAYQEMAGLLREAGQPEEAALIEAQWNRLLRRRGIRLFPGDAIDAFAAAD
jgi:KaiC/GvpD/RAD55 family RecA-like ATPase